MKQSYDENELLKHLASAIVDNPRSTIKELAEASGISKATLHRFCGTRESLEMMLADKAVKTLDVIIQTAGTDFESYELGLRKLIRVHYAEREFLRYHFNIQTCMDEEYWKPYSKSIDTFFLRGQKQGAFRIDFSDIFLSEIFTSSICGLIDSERRGRVAKSGIEENFEDFFLRGALNTDRK